MKTIKDIITESTLNQFKSENFNLWFEFQKARVSLSAWILGEAIDLTRQTGVNFEDVHQGHPETFEDVLLAWDECLSLKTPYKVYSGACDNSVYTTLHANLCFRFVHDFMHYLHNRDFSTESELHLGNLMVYKVGSVFGHDSAECLLMQADTIQQTLFYRDTEKFVDNQLLFALDYFKTIKGA